MIKSGIKIDQNYRCQFYGHHLFIKFPELIRYSGFVQSNQFQIMDDGRLLPIFRFTYT
uniref:Uncharacterized protein n=1 Tax=Tetranychus urticae TaxID=32264 RepID=T1KDV9_TETUR